jgi:hypothetical protein
MTAFPLQLAGIARALSQERFDFAAQLIIAGAGFAQQRRPFAELAFERGMKEPLDLSPAFSLHPALAYRFTRED